MKATLYVAAMVAGLCGQALAQPSELAVGRSYYAQAEFKKAVAHLQLALQTNPNDAEACYWIGMSYQAQATIAAPFDGKYTSKARAYLTKAVELAPDRQDYRRELFEFLLDSGSSSRTSRQQARNMLTTIPEADPDYPDMRRRFEQARKENSSAEARLGGLFLAAPRVAFRVAQLPASVLDARLHEQ